jgi:hypothetical protein
VPGPILQVAWLPLIALWDGTTKSIKGGISWALSIDAVGWHDCRTRSASVLLVLVKSQQLARSLLDRSNKTEEIEKLLLYAAQIFCVLCLFYFFSILSKRCLKDPANASFRCISRGSSTQDVARAKLRPETNIAEILNIFGI